MNEIDPKIVLQDLLYAIKSHGKLNDCLETNADNEYFVGIDGKLYDFFIGIDITERPYVSYRRDAIYYPVDLASPAESEISGNFAFDITSIECYNKESGENFELTNFIDSETLNQIKNIMNFDADGLVEDDDELYETRKIKLSEQDITSIVKRIINEVASKRTVINRIYKVTNKLTSGFYKDENWHGVTLVVDAIESLGYECEVSVKDGGYREHDGAKWKEYLLQITSPEGFVVHGTLNCHAAGSMQDPFDRYDMSLVMW